MTTQNTHGLHAGKVAWVTGAASGIGRAAVEELHSEGAQVVATDLPGGDFGWADALDGVITAPCDVTSEADNGAAVALAMESFGRLNSAVLNAGLPKSGPLLELPMDEFDQVMDVNVRGVVLGIRAAGRAMRPESAIVATASTSGMRGDPGMWPYNTSKAAVINLVRSASMDLAGFGIRINAVCPGPTETGMTTRFKDTDAYDDMRRRIPLQRWGLASELASVISFLLSTKASFVTGTHVPVDGGISANTGQFTPSALAP